MLHSSQRLERCDVAATGPYRITTPARTLIDLGAVVDEEVVEIALDSALRKRLTTIPRIEERLELVGGPGARCARALRRILGQRDPSARPCGSVLETKLLRLIRAHRLPPPVPQHEVCVGRLVLHPDFAYPEQRPAVAAVGSRAHFDRRSWERDLKRINLLAGAGWRVLHFAWDDVTLRPVYVVAEIRAALGAAAGVTGSPGPPPSSRRRGSWWRGRGGPPDNG